MGTSPSRGDAVSGYYPDFSGVSAVKIYQDNIKAQVVTGTITCAGVVYSKAHTLGVTPKTVIVRTWPTLAQAASATALIVAEMSKISAATSTAFYVAGNKGALAFKAYIQA